jgi:DNA-binding beta-propeller fold protein YncE
VARFDHPGGLTADATGTLYVSDSLNDTIRVISPAGAVRTLVGSAAHPAGFVDGLGDEARLDQPGPLLLAPDGMLYLADTGNHAIRRISPAGVVTTLAGQPGQDGLGGHADGSGGATGNARFDRPQGLALSPDGFFLYVADADNHVIRRVRLADGEVSTVAGSPGDFGHVDGTVANALFDTPSSLVFDRQGRLLVADTGNVVIRRIDLASGEVLTVAGSPGVVGHLDDDGDAALFDEPTLIERDSAGNLYVVDGSTVRSLDEPRVGNAYSVHTLYGQHTPFNASAQTTVGPLPRGLGRPTGLVLTPRRLYFTSGSAVLFIDR